MSDFKGNKLFVYGIVTAIFFVIFVRFYGTFSLNAAEYKFESLAYDISDNYIENISVNTDVSLFLKYFDITGYKVEVTSNNGEKIENNYVTNGSKTILYNKNNEIVKTYTNIIKGDIDNDGDVDNDDFSKFGECLVNKYSLEEYQIKSMDIDENNEVHINDLLLLDNAVTSGYAGITLNKESITLQSEEMGRLVASISPSYGINQNVKWTSLDENIAIVDDAGRVTGKMEGNTKVQAVTLDGKFIGEASIVVDNTIQLESYEGTGYVGGDVLRVKIKLIDYEGVSCNVVNNNVASCSIDGEYLVIESLKQGTSDIVVASPNYGEVTYKLRVYSVYLNIMPDYLCTTPGNVYYITVSSFHSGSLSFTSSDKEIISKAYMDVYGGRNMLRMEFGNKQGRATLTVKESNGNTTRDVVVDISRISIPAIGKFTKVGEEISTLIAGDHLGELSCGSEDETKATCKIEDNKLIVTPLAVGEVYVNVYNKFSYNDSLYDCGESQFLVVVQE